MNHSLIDVARGGAKGKCDSEFPEATKATVDVVNIALCNSIGCSYCPFWTGNQRKVKSIESRLRLLTID